MKPESSIKSSTNILLAAALIVCCTIFAFQPNLAAQDAPSNEQTAPAAKTGSTFTSDDWVTRDFWKSDKKLWQNSNGWEFEEGEIRLARPELSGHLYSPPLPPNFDLSWKWKIAEGTNSGLKYRLRRSSNALYDKKLLGVEYQITDDAAKFNIKKDSPDEAAAKQTTASIYGLIAPTADKPLNPPGQWNDARVVADGNQIKHFLNGQLVASATIGSIEWDTAMAKSKFYGVKDFGKPKMGDRIMLTDHGGKVAFKDFKFKALEAEPEFAQPPYLGNAIRNNWADQTSVVIWTRTTARPEMLADGMPFVRLNKKKADKLAQKTDADELLNLQLPYSATLDQMIGACPGSPGEVRLTYFPVDKWHQSRSTPWITTKASFDFTANWKLEDLKPGIAYAAVVEAKPIGGEKITAVIRGGFETAPQTNDDRDLKFCVTTCHDFIRTDNGLLGHKIYPAMTKIKPDFIVHAGDIEYYDKPDPWAMTMELMRFKWQRIFSLPDNRKFYQQTTSYFLKDDHDTLKDDCWPGQTYGSVSFEQGVKLFNEEQFPAAAPRYKTVRWGEDLQIWLLEGRDYRSPNDMPDGPEKTILGTEQKRWLEETLGQSNAKFKLVFCPTPIVGPDRDKKKDNHADDNFTYEGDELRKLLGGIDDLIVLCGDRHWQYASVQPETGLWEFGCGPGSEKHQLGWNKGDVRPEHKFLRVAGGFLSGEVVHAGPDQTATLTLRHHKVTGEEVSSFEFPMKEEDKEEAPDVPANPETKPVAVVD